MDVTTGIEVEPIVAQVSDWERGHLVAWMQRCMEGGYDLRECALAIYPGGCYALLPLNHESPLTWGDAKELYPTIELRVEFTCEEGQVSLLRDPCFDSISMRKPSRPETGKT